MVASEQLIFPMKFIFKQPLYYLQISYTNIISTLFLILIYIYFNILITYLGFLNTLVYIHNNYDVI